MNDEEQLPEPVVSPDLYNEDYYRRSCAGSAEWESSGGAEVASIYPGMLKLARLQPGEVVVDIGTGRGELLAVAIEQGAARAVGVEYAPAAVTLAEQTLRVHGVTDRAEVILADARSIPLDDDSADLVTMIDVVEHLSHEELDRCLREALRILRVGGRIFVHTMPNKTIYNVTYKIQRAIVPGRRRRWPADPRLHELEHQMHVNEQTVASLRRYIKRAGFRDARARLGRWIYTDFVPDERARLLYHRLSRIPVLNRFGIADLYGEGSKK